MLPKFLIADNSQELPEQVFVVHTESPRFIMQFELEDIYSDQVIYWIDDEPTDEDLISDLTADAEEFLEKELDNQESLYDDEGFEE
jgi:hypothetical protein